MIFKHLLNYVDSKRSFIRSQSYYSPLLVSHPTTPSLLYSKEGSPIKNFNRLPMYYKYYDKIDNIQILKNIIFKQFHESLEIFCTLTIGGREASID